MTSGNSAPTASTVRRHRWPAWSSTLCLCTSVSFLRGRVAARANASRTTRSTPNAVLTLTSVAISCGVPTRSAPPLPVYGPSVPSRTTTKSISPGSASGPPDAGEQPGRPQVHVLVELEAQSQEQAALERRPLGTPGSPMAPSRIASWSRISSSTESGRLSPVACQRRAPRSYSVGLDRDPLDAGDLLEDAQALGDDLGTDAVAGHDSEPDGGRRVGAHSPCSSIDSWIACENVTCSLLWSAVSDNGITSVGRV